MSKRSRQLSNLDRKTARNKIRKGVTGAALAALNLTTLAGGSPVLADVTDDQARLTVNYGGTGSWRNIDGTRDHTRYSHVITGRSTAEYPPPIVISSRFVDRRSWGRDHHTSWVEKGICKPDRNGDYRCQIDGTMGSRWDEQQLKYRPLAGGDPARFVGQVTFHWKDNGMFLTKDYTGCPC